MKKFELIKTKLSSDWENKEPVLQLDELLRAANEILQPEGNWILLNADLTLREFLNHAEE